jgi:protease-4
MNETSPKTSHPWGVGAWIIYIILPLIVGILLSMLIPKPVIGVIRLDDAIYSYSAQDMIAQIEYAREHPNIRAVVFIMNSPGGTVTDTESVYMELARLREKKPVVMVVEGMAASGGYYLLSGSDYAFAKPSSMVGNVGVIGYTPSTPSVYEEIYSTGPYKMWGEPKDTFIREMEMLKQGFYSAVSLGRGSRLKVGAEVILRGQIWTGSEALRLGLVDELGTISQAYDKAASMALIANYEIKDLREMAGLPVYSGIMFFQTTKEGVVTPYPKEFGIYMLYIPSAEGRQ